MSRIVTVPMIVEQNRPFVELHLAKHDGGTRRARAWVDTGGGGFIICKPLATELRLTTSDEVIEDQGGRLSACDPPAVQLGGVPLDLGSARCFVSLDRATLSPGVSAECLIPGHVLMRSQVVFDYQRKTLTMAKPGASKPRGIPIPTPIGEQFGFPRIEVEIDGEAHGLLLDTGSSYTMISQTLIDRWTSEHPDWPRADTPVGDANMGISEAGLSMVRLPSMKLGELELPNIGVVARPAETFERWISQMTPGPVIGALGGNALRSFRIEIDYQEGTTYFEGSPVQEPRDTDCVGLTIKPDVDGTFSVAAVSARAAQATRDAVQPGDELIEVEGTDVIGLTLAAVIDLLRGEPDEERAIVLGRDEQKVEVRAPVVRIL